MKCHHHRCIIIGCDGSITIGVRKPSSGRLKYMCVGAVTGVVGHLPFDVDAPRIGYRAGCPTGVCEGDLFGIFEGRGTAAIDAVCNAIAISVWKSFVDLTIPIIILSITILAGIWNRKRLV